MDGEAVREIERITEQNQTVKIDGVTFGSQKYEPIVAEHGLETIEVGTLSGLVDAVRENVDAVDLSRAHVLVESHKKVSLITAGRGVFRHRDRSVEARWDDVTPFEFRQWMSQEAFVIALRSLFVQTDGLIDVIEYASSVKIDNSAQIEDDGVTQSAQVKRSASGALTSSKIAPSIVELQPYRTFSEIEQPKSQFLFRMRHGDFEVSFALFESDGGEWRRKARNAIKEYLEERDLGVKILA